jgi:hypothetical protein
MSGFFPAESRAAFAGLYPQQAGVLRHLLREHALLTIPALTQLGEALPPAQVEYNPGDLPIGIAPEAVPSNGMTIGDTIRTIASCNSWAVLKNVESMPGYAALLDDLLSELAPAITAVSGPMLRTQAYIFISSPGSMTPFHFDPEHNILLQLCGTKTMRVYPAGDPRFAKPAEHERYHRGGHRNLPWREDFAQAGLAVDLHPGDAVYVPVMAPHFVRNGDAPSISLSITWRSAWSFAEADAHAFNSLLRQAGWGPAMPPRFPATARGKVIAWRALRKLGIVG